MTRFYLHDNGTSAVTVAYDSAWDVTTSPAATSAYRCNVYRRPYPTALATTGSYTSTAGQNRLHRQYVSHPLKGGILFDSSATYKCYVQVLESQRG